MIFEPYKDILLIKKNNNIWSKVINRFVNDKNGYIHSEYVIDNWLTLGTDLKRPVSIHSFSYNIKDIDVFRYQGNISSKQKEIIDACILKLLESTYDTLEAICVGLKLSCKGSATNFICISLIVEIMEKAGLLPKGINGKYKDFTVFTDSSYFKKMNFAEITVPVYDNVIPKVKMPRLSP